MAKKTEPNPDAGKYIVLEQINAADDPTQAAKTSDWRPCTDKNGLVLTYEASGADKAIDLHTGKGVEGASIKKGVWKAIAVTAWKGIKETGTEQVSFSRPVDEVFKA